MFPKLQIALEIIDLVPVLKICGNHRKMVVLSYFLEYLFSLTFYQRHNLVYHRDSSVEVRENQEYILQGSIIYNNVFDLLG